MSCCFVFPSKFVVIYCHNHRYCMLSSKQKQPTIFLFTFSFNVTWIRKQSLWTDEGYTQHFSYRATGARHRQSWRWLVTNAVGTYVHRGDLWTQLYDLSQQLRMPISICQYPSCKICQFMLCPDNWLLTHPKSPCL